MIYAYIILWRKPFINAIVVISMKARKHATEVSILNFLLAQVASISIYLNKCAYWLLMNELSPKNINFSLTFEYLCLGNCRLISPTNSHVPLSHFHLFLAINCLLSSSVSFGTSACCRTLGNCWGYWIWLILAGIWLRLLKGTFF